MTHPRQQQSPTVLVLPPDKSSSSAAPSAPVTPPLLPALPSGETISECAVREVMEETGVTILNQPDPSSEGISSRLSYPTPFAAVDSIVRNDQGGYKYHYAVIDVGGCAG
jgi:hypothetical protein